MRGGSHMIEPFSEGAAAELASSPTGILSLPHCQYPAKVKQVCIRFALTESFGHCERKKGCMRRKSAYMRAKNKIEVVEEKMKVEAREKNSMGTTGTASVRGLRPEGAV